MAQNIVRNYSPPSASLIALAFCAGFLAVLVFHQGMLAFLHAIGFTPGVPYQTKPTAPLGIPEIWSLAFWGGVWGIVFALVTPVLPNSGAYFAGALLFGAIFPTLVAWFVVSLLKGLPPAGGWRSAAMATAVMVNAAWGIGTALLLAGAGFSRLRHAD